MMIREGTVRIEGDEGCMFWASSLGCVFLVLHTVVARVRLSRPQKARVICIRCHLGDDRDHGSQLDGALEVWMVV